MNLYEYQRSRPFNDLGPNSLRFNIFIFFLGTARLIEVKFHVESPWDGGTKVCSNGPGHMTNMAAMPIYGKKIFSGTLKFSMQHRVLEYYQVCSIKVDLDLFYDKVKVGPLCFYKGKG